MLGVTADAGGLLHIPGDIIDAGVITDSGYCWCWQLLLIQEIIANTVGC
jgi:hypothetical protein